MTRSILLSGLLLGAAGGACQAAEPVLKFNDKGELIDNELGQTLVEFLNALAAWTRKIKGTV